MMTKVSCLDLYDTHKMAIETTKGLTPSLKKCRYEMAWTPPFNMVHTCLNSHMHTSCLMTGFATISSRVVSCGNDPLPNR